MKIGWQVCAAVVAACSVAPATAASTIEAVPYIGVAGLYQSPDSSRQSKDGFGFRAWAGLPLTEHGALELSALDLERTRHGSGGNDHEAALFVDYVYDFGVGTDKPGRFPGFKPYLLTGPGIARERTFGHAHDNPALEVGGGLLFPLRIGSWDWDGQCAPRCA